MATISDVHAIVIGGLVRGDMQTTSRVMFGSGLLRSDFPTDLQPLYDGIVNTMKEGTVPTPETVWINSGKVLALDEIRGMVQFAANYSDDALISNAKAVITMADRQGTHTEIQKALMDIQNERIAPSLVRENLAAALARSRASEIQPADTLSIRDRIKARMGKGELQPLPSSIEWLNVMTNGGFRPRRLIGIGGGEKSRKTTLVRNILMSIMRKAVSPKPGAFGSVEYIPRPDVSVAFLAFENDQETTMLDFVSMLAMENLWNGGMGRSVCESVYGNIPYYAMLNPELILTAMDNGKIDKWPAQLRLAIDWAWEAVTKLPLSIYDMNPQNGGLYDDADMSRVMNMHNALVADGKKYKIIVVDYLSLVATPKRSAYEGQTEVVARLLHSANAQDTTVFALAQYSRGYQRDGEDKKQQKTVGTDNSPALERSCHHYFEVAYDEEHPQLLTAKQVRARRAAGGKNSNMKKLFWIHPISGLVLSAYENNTVLLKESAK
jgi:replicative DNA helicase